MTLKFLQVEAENIWLAIVWFVVVAMLCGALAVAILTMWRGNCDNEEVLFLRKRINELTQSSV